jgi:ribosome-interacting GTPase 1
MIREDVSRTLAGSVLTHARQITVDEFIDVLIGTRKYIPAISVYNKIDSISLEQLDKYARQDHTVVISCELGLKLVSITLSYFGRHQ